MIFQISTLSKDDVGSFYPVFATTMRTVFACYSPKVIEFFTEKIYTPANLIYWLNNNLKTVIVAKKSNNDSGVVSLPRMTDSADIVGFAMVDQPYGGVSFCRWLAVLKRFQGKGVGRKLVQAWENLAKSQGCHKIELGSQPLAKKFYEKVGLTLEGERKLSYFGIDQFIFGKVIGEAKEEEMVKYY